MPSTKRSGETFIAGTVFGIAAVASIGAASPPNVGPPQTLQPVAVTLHRFDIKPGSEPTFRKWIDFLHARHRDSVATLAREHTYFEAMFTAPDEPRRLYWIEVQGAGGASVDTSQLDVDREHMAYMDAVLAKGSHARLATRNVLAPDFIIAAVRDEQRREESR